MLIKSLRFKLSIFYSSVFIFFISLLCIFLFKYYKNIIYKNIDENLIKEAKILSSESNEREIINENTEMIKIVGDKLYKIININGTVITGSFNDVHFKWPLNKELMFKTVEKGLINFETLNSKGENYRLLYYPINKESLLRIGRSLYHTETNLIVLKKLGTIFIVLLFLISIAMGLVLSWIAIRPLVKIRSLVERIASSDLRQRIDYNVKESELKKLIDVLNKLLENVKNFTDSYKNFISDVSHELRSPLTVLRGSIEVALRKKRTTDEYEKILQNNLSSTLRLSKIIDNLLFLSRTDNNLLNLRMEYFDLSNLLKNIVEQRQEIIKSNRLKIVEYYEEHIEIFGDMDLLSQAFSNIIDNAIKYSNPGGTITIKALKTDKNITVTISDTGVGIAEEDIPYIFERFYRAKKDHSSKKGVGLGLYIARCIIDAHKGTISVKSTLGLGTDFVVLIPLD